MEKIEMGTGRLLREGEDLLFLSIGPVGNYVTEVCDTLEKEGQACGHIDARFVKPLDEKLLTTAFQKYKTIITVEDGALHGGFGSAILEFAAENNYKNDITRLGIPDKVIEHGNQHQLHKECKFDVESIYKTAVSKLTQHISSLPE